MKAGRSRLPSQVENRPRSGRGEAIRRRGAGTGQDGVTGRSQPEARNRRGASDSRRRAGDDGASGPPHGWPVGADARGSRLGLDIAVLQGTKPMLMPFHRASTSLGLSPAVSPCPRLAPCPRLDLSLPWVLVPSTLRSAWQPSQRDLVEPESSDVTAMTVTTLAWRATRRPPCPACPPCPAADPATSTSRLASTSTRSLGQAQAEGRGRGAGGEERAGGNDGGAMGE